MVNFKNNIKVIISVSGDTEDFTAISVHDKALLGDSLHLIDSNKFTFTSAMVSVGKHLKDNAQHLPDVPKEFSTEAKLKKLSIIAFPLILPLVKGYKIPEGDIDDDETYDELCKVHEVYADWPFLQSKTYILNQEFFHGEIKCPIPKKVCDKYGFLKRYHSRLYSNLKKILQLITSPKLK